MNILILTYYRYPNGDAGAIRQHTFAKLFQSAGHHVFIVGMGDCTGFEVQSYDSVDYISFRHTSSSKIDKVKNIVCYNKNLKIFIEKNKNIYDTILIVDIPLLSLFWVKSYAKKYNIQLLHDSVEWYSPEQFKYGKYDISYILKDLYNRKWIDNNFKVITISKYLEQHFNLRNIETVRVPVIMDIDDIAYNKNIDKEKTTIVYAGSPGKKDYLKEVLDGTNLLSDEELSKLELRIIGITKHQLIDITGVDKHILGRLCDKIKFIGRVAHEKVLKNLEQADFTVLLRSPVQRYAKAGFPTKVVESLASATPVILNITSDLGDYIHDMQEGVIVEDCSAKAYAQALKRVLALSSKDKREMQKIARLCAETHFDYRQYSHILKNLIGSESR